MLIDTGLSPHCLLFSPGNTVQGIHIWHVFILFLSYDACIVNSHEITCNFALNIF